MCVLKYEQSECFKLDIHDIFRVRNGFNLVFCRNRDWNGVFLTYVLNFLFRAVFSGKSNERKPHKKSPEK